MAFKKKMSNFVSEEKGITNIRNAFFKNSKYKKSPPYEHQKYDIALDIGLFPGFVR